MRGLFDDMLDTEQLQEAQRAFAADARYRDLCPTGVLPDSYGVVRLPVWPVTQPLIRDVCEQQLAPGSRVLEAGCGDGLLYRIAGHRAGVWKQFDSDAQSIERAHRYSPAAQSQVAELRDIHAIYGTGQTDAVVELNVLDMFNFNALLRILQQIRRVLVRGGILLSITDLNVGRMPIFADLPSEWTAVPGTMEQPAQLGVQLIERGYLPRSREAARDHSSQSLLRDLDETAGCVMKQFYQEYNVQVTHPEVTNAAHSLVDILLLCARDPAGFYDRLFDTYAKLFEPIARLVAQAQIPVRRVATFVDLWIEKLKVALETTGFVDVAVGLPRAAQRIVAQPYCHQHSRYIAHVGSFVGAEHLSYAHGGTTVDIDATILSISARTPH